MTELVLILGINLAGLTFATMVARWAVSRDVASAEVRRLSNAVERAARGLLSSCFRQVSLAVGLLALGLAGLHLYVYDQGADLRLVVWSLLGLFVGALLTCALSLFAVQLSHRTATGTIAAIRIGVDRTLRVSIRAGGSIGLISECLGILGVCLLFALLRALSGGDSSVPLARAAAYVLGGYALGTAVAALMVQRVGAVYQTASDVGAQLGGERDADFKPWDPRNPAAVAKLVGDHVGCVAPRAIDLFVCGSVANTAVLLVGMQTFAKPLAEGKLALLLLPLVVKSFGVIASAFGVMVVRSEEKSDPTHAVWRGHTTTLVICLGALLGSTLWLVGPDHWPPFFVAGSLGLLVATAAAYAGSGRWAPRVNTPRSMGDVLKLGDAVLLADGLAAGLRAALLPSTLMFAALALAWHLGQASGVAGGGMLAIALALMGMLASGPFMLAVNVLSPVTHSGHGVGCIAGFGEADEEIERRTHRLQEAGLTSNAFAQTFWLLVSGVAALYAASVLLSQGSNPTNSTLTLAHPSVAYSGLLGAVCVLVYAGGVLHAASRSLRGVVVEVERQLGGFPKERGKYRVPEEYVPSYRACIEIVTRFATTRPLLPVLLVILLPLILGPLLVLSTDQSAATARAALASFVLSGAVTGLTAAFAAETIRASVGHVRRQARKKPESFDSALQANSFAELLGTTAGPAAQLVFKTAAVSALAVAPFLS